ncbi:uncharacterized protein AB675_4737 [Cyphellophora attinorum]|uniref:Aminoglycoside phosphotransferase domain-containing protein n=1 Tax=Cyphellophora attinorum TaxID=1664694 RepID=A0A0N1GY94_9EURO|nr:uncharacterized protein AB675_4737 [Phialophora attinorum]KPI35635.1 hypothetical protein AB675_4737 [Phialophora attinorum]
MLDTIEPKAGFLRNLIFPVLMYFGRKIMYDSNRKIVQISTTLLIKGPCTEQELEALLFIMDRPSIQAPKVHRTYRRHDGLFIEIDFIHGQRLDQAWPKLGVNERKAVMQELGEMISAIRNVRNHTAVCVGSVRGGSFKDGRIASRTNAPCPTVEQFHLQLRGGVPLEQCQETFGDDVYESHRRDYRSVFSHADLCPRNIIIVMDSLQPVLIDWEFSGWWPEYWEHTKSVFSMWEEVPGWEDELAKVLPQYPLALSAEKVLWMSPTS